MLLSDLVPKKADEIALDELIKYSFDHKQSTSYKKIIDAVFEQQASKVQDATFDLTNCKVWSDILIFYFISYIAIDFDSKFF